MGEENALEIVAAQITFDNGAFFVYIPVPIIYINSYYLLFHICGKEDSQTIVLELAAPNDATQAPSQVTQVSQFMQNQGL